MSRLNLTTQRKTILDLIQSCDDHPTAAEIMERLRMNGHQFAYGTVYNSLRYLTDAGLIRELKLGETASRYDGRTEDHYHIVCTKCGRVDEVLSAPPAEWIREVAAKTNYDVHHSQVVFEGVCYSCKHPKA
ncbi:Fur family transcriptional regulator [Paenibacillus ehimensis]|uniref:Transcriptional repressor n=1 Tax=Paenibacillus ehimensis TaxID=79264 RepID=A0ABT8V820_9BACL|nr:transcriptional repressor [Paenibacillus ehimensis]MDO3677605.1 transcriptional repressor [Paenibacillus ehimensis]MEC0208884.1 transcriptional repressor [Paenibacillus ehimensis]